MNVGSCQVLEYNGGPIATNIRFDKLITLRTAVENGGRLLDKKATIYYNIFDAFRILSIRCTMPPTTLSYGA